MPSDLPDVWRDEDEPDFFVRSATPTEDESDKVEDMTKTEKEKAA